MQNITPTQQNIPSTDLPASTKSVQETPAPAATNALPSEDATTPRKKTFLSVFLRGKQNDTHPTAPATKKDDTTPGKKTLPQDVRDHFEANSSAFVAFAQKKDTGLKSEMRESKEMDAWDKALLLGQYPGGNIPMDIHTPSSFGVSVPKRPPSPTEGNILPNQVFAEMRGGLKKESDKTEPVNKQTTPIDISVEKITLPRFIPRKPQDTTAIKTDGTQNTSIPNTDTRTNRFNGFLSGNITIPKKPISLTATEISQPQNNTLAKTEHMEKNIPTSIMPEPGMGEMLQKKIIEGQLRGIFENAPEGIRENLEKMPARDILSVMDTAGDTQRSDDVWKRRLRDYIIKLKWQGKTAFKNAADTDPKENETAAAFIQRIYPSIIKVEMREE